MEIFPKARLAEDKKIELESKLMLGPVDIAYKTYGQLNKDKSNAILICHALTGDQFVASTNPITNEPGWWTEIVGKNKIIDPDKHYIICSNVLGGCMGTSGPTQLDNTGKELGMQFPVITIGDMVSVQERLINYLGIDKLLCIIGGSMGGMQVLEWLRKFPYRMNAVASISTSYKNSAQNIAFHEVGRQAIISDPFWNNGNYYNMQNKPVNGLSVARMLAHITYLSPKKMQIKFGRMLQDIDSLTYEFKNDFRVQNYLHYQGDKFTNRFDANSYLFLTKAMDYFDMEYNSGGDLPVAFRRGDAKIYLASFTSDWLFPVSDILELEKVMKSVKRDVTCKVFKSDNGHDAFLLFEPEFQNSLNNFISNI